MNKQSGPRRVKIVATIGPSSSDAATIRALVRAGLDVARINFSHADPAQVPGLVRRLRAAAQRSGRPLALLADLPGPKLRIGDVGTVGIALDPGTRIALLPGRRALAPGERPAIPVPHGALVSRLASGTVIFLDDGMIRLRVEGASQGRVWCRVLDGGTLRSRKGIAIPGPLNIPAIGRADLRAVRQAVELGFDYIAVSFVRDARDVRRVRRLTRLAGRELPVIAKLERPEAIAELDSIIAAADGVMVARGDLGVSLPVERVPVLQKRIIAAANRAAKPCITATQMLESMTQAPLPTRAEVSDVANAILDGTDAVMLSAETASGRFPERALRTMDAVARTTEQSGISAHADTPLLADNPAAAVGRAACQAARDVGARWIVAFTRTGASARLLSALRPATPICALTADQQVRRSLALYWGVTALRIERLGLSMDVAAAASARLKAERLARRGDKLVLVFGRALGTPGSTDTLTIYTVE